MGTATANPLALPTVTSFGPYELLERLAVGGMSEIFRARSCGPQGYQRDVIIKRMLPHLASDPEFVEMFIDEARVMGRLNHPKIVQVLDFGDVDGHLYIAMEPVDGLDGLSLMHRCALHRLRPPAPAALFIISEILDALDYAHALADEDGQPLRIVHRDVTPSNIFITRRGDVKLGDFGIARAALRRCGTKTGVLKGKYSYMAPEIVDGAVADQRSDIFSAGVVLAELPMMRALFSARSDLEVLLQVRDARLDRLDEFGQHIPAPLREILEAALARDPSSRYQDAASFRDALLHYLHASGMPASNCEVRRLLQRLESELLLEPDEEALLAPPVGSVQTNRSLRPQVAGSDSTSPRQVGHKRKVLLAPPPPPAGRTDSTPRLQTEDALAAIPELQGSHDREISPALELPNRDLARLPTELAAAPGLSAPGLSAPGERVLAARDERWRDRGAPDDGGELDERSLLRLIFDLAVREETGLVVLRSDSVTKEIFLADGHPRSVTSNQREDLFGQYLVQQQVISDGELAMALAMLPHFDGKLGDALVGLRLLNAMDVLRHLTRQVRQKLIDCFAWTHGRFEYFSGQRSPDVSAPLGLDAFELLGAAATQIPDDVLASRLTPLMTHPARALEAPPVPPEVFRLGELPRRLLLALDGRPLGVVAQQLSTAEPRPRARVVSRDLVDRVAYLLIETGLALLV